MQRIEMYRISELEEYLKCTYPTSVSSETQERRMTNIHALQNLISTAIDERALNYGVLEERLHLFTTKADEKVFIQYPGKESIAGGANQRRFDFRPRIMTADGTMIRDLVFADMWSLVENLNCQIHSLLKSMSCLFFRMGRMTIHQWKEEDYPYEIIDASGCVLERGSRNLNWYLLDLEQGVINTFDYLAPALYVKDAPSISLEAFIYFFEMILNNEDSKYFDKKRNLSSGRIPTSDSMLLLSSNLIGKTSLSNLLQRFVSGFGVAKCLVGEIGVATEGLVKIVDRKKDLISFLSENGIEYMESSSITVRGTSYSVAIKTYSPKIALLRCNDPAAKEALESARWTVYSLNDLLSDEAFDNFCTEITTL